MTIANKQFEGLGAHVYAPEGPFGAVGNFPMPSFAPGEVVAGDCESEFVYLLFAPTTAVTVNQGDVLLWDHTYVAIQTLAATASNPFGADYGTFFLGGRVGDPAAAPGQGVIWSYTFAPGVYGIWAQRAGTSIMNITGTINTVKPVTTTSTAGQATQTTALTSPSGTLNGVYSAVLTSTFTATTTTGSAVLTVVASPVRGLAKGMTLSGTGVPNGTYIVDFAGSSVTMSAAATANGTTITITATNGTTWNTVGYVNGSTFVTVANIPGIYPNATIAGTNLSSVIKSITGVPGNYQINLVTAATGTGAANALGVTGYPEVFLRWPYCSAQN